MARRPAGSNPYGTTYRKLRERLLASNPVCAWCGVNPATTADHDPPIAEVGRIHYNLVPACARCNFGRVNKERAARVAPSRSW